MSKLFRGVYQTIFHETRGNCQAACLATILGVPLESIADAPDLSWTQRWEVQNGWLKERNLYMLCLSTLTIPLPGFSIAGVKSPRFPNTDHAVVCFNGRIVWDPHPEGCQKYGFDYADTFDHTILVQINPALAFIATAPVTQEEG